MQISRRQVSLHNKSCYFCGDTSGSMNIMRLNKSSEISYFYHGRCAYEANKERLKIWREKNRDRVRIAARERYRSRGEPYQEKRKIWSRAKYNIAKQPCEVCGNPDSKRHHPDYSKPLEVVFLCNLHHKQVAHKDLVKEKQ